MISSAIRQLGLRVARLERLASPPKGNPYYQKTRQVEDAVFKVGGARPMLGADILKMNEYDPDVRAALEIALKEGFYEGHMMEDIELIAS
jgi:hypothetical protein